MKEQYVWKHKNLLDTMQLSKEDVLHLLDLAANFQEINRRPVKKAPVLKGKSIVLFFAENSTRTRVSFDMAGKRLNADTFALGSTGSSIQKGENLKDTGLTLKAMNPDVLVIRHSSSGAPQYLAETLNIPVVNAGDGWHAHPTQALLDSYSLNDAWSGNFKGKKLLILGDIAHSRVARSNIDLLHKLGVQLRLCAPRTLLPAGIDNLPVEVYNDLHKATEGMDAVMCLRLQLERQQAGLLPDLSEYASRYCLKPEHLLNAAPNVKVLHPGPMNRGLEISAEIADSDKSLVTDQVAAGVAIRMAVLYLLAMYSEAGAN